MKALRFIIPTLAVILLVGLFWFYVHDVWRAVTYRFHEATVDFVTGDVEYRFFGFRRAHHSFPADVRDFVEENSLDLERDQRFVRYKPGNHPEKVYPDYRGMRFARNHLWKIAAWREIDPEIAGMAIRLYQEERFMEKNHQNVWMVLAGEARWNSEASDYVPNPSLGEHEISERNRMIEQIGRGNE